MKTHLRDMLIVPEMVGSVVGIHNGRTYNQVEIKVRIPPQLPVILCSTMPFSTLMSPCSPSSLSLLIPCLCQASDL